jgi:hypothetical protein
VHTISPAAKADDGPQANAGLKPGSTPSRMFHEQPAPIANRDALPGLSLASIAPISFSRKLKRRSQTGHYLTGQKK